MDFITGGQFIDQRGLLRFVNDFDMKQIRRMYLIEPTYGQIRAWQGHKKEQKWFFVLEGSFIIQTVSMQEQQNRSKMIVLAEDNRVIHINSGNYNGFEALAEGSKMLVFSDHTIDEAASDDFRMKTEELAWNV
ncbi:MAG: WxcM-like domain-containing protein [Flavobacterium psychrophilum]